MDDYPPRPAEQHPREVHAQARGACGVGLVSIGVQLLTAVALAVLGSTRPPADPAAPSEIETRPTRQNAGVSSPPPSRMLAWLVTTATMMVALPSVLAHLRRPVVRALPTLAARSAAVGGGWTLPAVGAAHSDGVAWNAAPSGVLLILLPLLAGTLLYVAGLVRRAANTALAPRSGGRAACFGLGVVLLATALIGPLDAWAELSFSAHMAQHMVLIALAPPLLLLGRPGAAWLRALPYAWRAAVVSPRRWPGAQAAGRWARSVAATSLLHGAVLWGWHAPAAFEMALRHAGVHWLEHITLLASGMLFWRALLHARGVMLGWGLAWMLVTVIHSGMLGALITLAPRPLYGIYVERDGVANVLADQQLAGLIMWVPMGTVYLLAALALAARGLRGHETSPL